MGNRNSQTDVVKDISEHVAYYKCKKVKNLISALTGVRKIMMIEYDEDIDQFGNSHSIAGLDMDIIIKRNNKDLKKYDVVITNINSNVINIIDTLYEDIYKIYFDLSGILIDSKANDATLVKYDIFEKIIGKKMKYNGETGNVIDRLKKSILSLPNLTKFYFESLENIPLKIIDIEELIIRKKIKSISIYRGIVDDKFIDFILENVNEYIRLSDSVDGIAVIMKLKYYKNKISQLELMIHEVKKAIKLYEEMTNIRKINNPVDKFILSVSISTPYQTFWQLPGTILRGIYSLTEFYMESNKFIALGKIVDPPKKWPGEGDVRFLF